MRKIAFLIPFLLIFSGIIISQDEMYLDDPLMPDMEGGAAPDELDGLEDMEGPEDEPSDSGSDMMMDLGMEEDSSIDDGGFDLGESEIPGEEEEGLPGEEEEEPAAGSGAEPDLSGDVTGEGAGMEGMFPEEETETAAPQLEPTPAPKKKKYVPKTILASTLTNKIYTKDGRVRWFRNLRDYMSWDIDASSAHDGFRAGNVGDDNVTTAWVSGDRNDGIGETITMYFDEFNFAPVYEAGKRKIKINNLRILNGYVDTEDEFEKYNRMKKIKIMKNGKTILYANLHDSLNWQTVKLPYSVTIRPYDKLQVKILEVFPEVRNARNTSVAVTEIALVGGF